MKSEILETFPNLVVKQFNTDFFVADYTLQTQNRRTVEISENLPDDIESFHVKNTNSIVSNTIIFSNDSFVDEKGNAQSQCECMAFADSGRDTNTWVLFVELKYCKYENASKKLNEARKQLFNTLEVFKSRDLIGRKQTCYLIASLPKQSNLPFRNFMPTPDDVARLRRDNIVYREVNEVQIIDYTKIEVFG